MNNKISKLFEGFRARLEEKVEDIVEQNDNVWKAEYSTSKSASVDLEQEALFDQWLELRLLLDEFEDKIIQIEQE